MSSDLRCPSPRLLRLATFVTLLATTAVAWGAPSITISKDAKAIAAKDPTTSPNLPQIVDGNRFLYTIFGASFNGATTAPLVVTDTVPEHVEVLSASVRYRNGGKDFTDFATVEHRTVTYTFPTGTTNYELLIEVRTNLGNTETQTIANRAKLIGGGEAGPKESNISTIKVLPRFPDFIREKHCAPHNNLGYCAIPDDSWGYFSLDFYDRSKVGAFSEVVLTDTVPPQLAVVDVSPGCTFTGQTVRCTWPVGTKAGSALVEVFPVQFGPWDNVFTLAAGAHQSALLDLASANPQTSNKVSGEVSPPQSNPVGITGPTQVAVGVPVTFQSSLAGGATAIGAIQWVDSSVAAEVLAAGTSVTRTFAEPGNYTLYDLAKVHRSGFTDASFMTPHAVNVTAAAPGCHADPNTLCLQGNRFRVQVDWQSLRNQTNGVGAAHPITTDTGAFSFFNAANQELVVKVIDGRGLNHAFWVFYGALTNVQFELKVTDTQTGQVKTYVNPQDNQASVADTSAFPTSSTSTLAEDRGLASDNPTELVQASIDREAVSPRFEPQLSCATAGPNLCLSGRFLVSVQFLANGQKGAGTAASLTAESGTFWFFNSANVELITKIVDGRGTNGKFWFFYGALSDVAYIITVVDTQTGKVQHYYNFQGGLASVADTSAF